MATGLRNPTTARTVVLALLIGLYTAASPAVAQTATGDERALALARTSLDKMGGQQAWNNTRYVRWSFFDRNMHYWDKWSGNIRIESQDRLVLMNINTLEGRVWEKGQEITNPDDLKAALVRGHRTWVNDSYWMFMPWKVLDPGVTLRYVGESKLEADGRACDTIEMTFEAVGYTPQNKYLICIARDTGLVEQWKYFPSRDEPEPKFTLVWAGWRRFGNIMLSTDRGNGYDWKAAVYDTLPESVFTSPEPVSVR